MPRLMFFYDFFYPGYKAGGPIQSLVNLAITLEPYYEICIVTSDHDLHEKEQLQGITPAQWNEVQLPGRLKGIWVWYNQGPLTTRRIHTLLKEKTPSVIYINGIFTYSFVIKPIIAASLLKNKPAIIVCPRGMLQEGNFKIKHFKKAFYLRVIRVLRIFRNVRWHATTPYEREDILARFPFSKNIIVANNVGKPPVAKFDPVTKQTGVLNICYLSLINQKKNLYLLLECLAQTGRQITLDIYGPVADQFYWKKCEGLIKKMPARVRYCGAVLPSQIQDTIKKHHALVLLSSGENFGHSLYESMSAGRPVITSYFTPWTYLEENKAGWNVDIFNQRYIIDTLNSIADMGQEDFDSFCRGAYELAMQTYLNRNTVSDYIKLFGHINTENDL